jgi:hypothetical protein
MDLDGQVRADFDEGKGDENTHQTHEGVLVTKVGQLLLNDA